MNRRTLLLLSLILAGGLFLRTVHLSERGLLVPDEAGYYSIPASAAVHAPDGAGADVLSDFDDDEDGPASPP